MSKTNDVNSNNYNSNIHLHSYSQQNAHYVTNNTAGITSPAVIMNISNQTSTNNIQQYGNIDPAVKILDDTLNLIRTGDREIDAKGENVVLICGDTGAGKSTLINYLIGNELVAVKQQNSKIHDINVKDNSNAIKIGHGIASETFMPNKAKQLNSGVIYYDCPGFSDSRGPVKDIANAFAINKIFASAEKVQIMLVIEETSLTGAKRGQNFIDLLNTVSNLFENKEDFVKNTVLVFTKVKETEDFTIAITKVINEDAQRDEPVLSVPQKLLLQDILANAKIVTFTSPNKVGPIDLEERTAILAASDNTPYAIKPKVNITVSTSSLLTLQKLTETVNKQIKSNVKKLGELLTTNLDKIPLSKLEEIKASINQLNVREFTSDDEIVEFIETRIANLVTTNSPDINKDKVTIALQEVKSLVGYFSQFFAKILPHAHVESDKLKGAFTFHTLNAFEKAINNEVLKNNQEKLKEVNATLDKNQKEFKAQLDKQAANFANAAKDNANRITALAEQLKSEKQQRVDLNKLFENSKIEVNSLRSTINANQKSYQDQFDKQAAIFTAENKNNDAKIDSLDKQLETSKIEINNLRSTINTNQKSYKDQFDKQAASFAAENKNNNAKIDSLAKLLEASNQQKITKVDQVRKYNVHRNDFSEIQRLEREIYTYVPEIMKNGSHADPVYSKYYNDIASARKILSRYGFTYSTDNTNWQLHSQYRRDIHILYMNT